LWLPLPAAFLVAEDAIDRADVILVLSGSSRWRVPAAARLYGAGQAPRVVVSSGSGSNALISLALGQRLAETQLITAALERLGVPGEAIEVLDGDATSTYNEAVAFREYVRAHSVKSAILVTSHLHSRRAGWIFRKVLNNPSHLGVKLSLVEAEQPAFTTQNWWRTEDGLVAVFNEYLKLAYYVVHY